MSLAIVSSRAIAGLDAPVVRVEVHLAQGLPAFNIVGMPDTGVKESRERVRSAIQNSGYSFPAGRLTANLAPADVPKDSSRFDLPMALGILWATNQIKPANSKQALQEQSNMVFVGELSLTGALVSVAAPLVIALAVYKQNPDAILVMPSQNAQIAACLSGLKVLSANTLKEVVDYLNGIEDLNSAIPIALSESVNSAVCLSDVKGQALACKVLEIAAAGGHSLLMSGPPGVGKSMLAQRLPTLLPALDQAQTLELLAIQGLSGLPLQYSKSAPFRNPHHTASTVALIGGGAKPRPGEISLAHHGVLFLDELPEFNRHLIESLREPLENGEIAISRARGQITYPARFQLVAAMNPCPCGYLGHAKKMCRCSPDMIDRYQSKISGPFLDRIDLCLQLSALDERWQYADAAESSAIVRQRVKACRERQLKRQSVLNAHLGSAHLQHLSVDSNARGLLDKAIENWSLSGRVVHKLLKVALTLADLDELDHIQAKHIAQALQFRQLSKLDSACY